MQLLRTDCSFAIDPNKDAVHLVKFVGEGGESIEVRLAAASDSVNTDTQLIAKAAATMVQVASFLVDAAAGDEETSIADPSSKPESQVDENGDAPDKPVPLGPGPSPRPDIDPTPEPPVFPG